MRFLLVLSVVALGCSDESQSCLAIEQAAIELRVLGTSSCDAVKVTVWTTEGWFQELRGTCSFELGWGRAGTYSLAVEAKGHRTLTEHGIVVPWIGGACPGPETVKRTVTLEPDGVDAGTSFDAGGCCPIAEWPSCDCFPTGGSGACMSICDGPPPAWSKEYDDNGCPYWKLHPTTLSCFPPPPDAGTSG